MKRAGLISRRWSRRLVAVSLTGMGTLALWPIPHAGADAPDQRGYWVETSNPGAQPPQQPPTIPNNGLYVAYSPQAGPTAISALRFNIGDERSGTLVLRVHPATSGVSAPTPPEEVRPVTDQAQSAGSNVPAAPQNVHLAACIVTKDWKATGPTEMGAWSDRPTYSTTGCIPGNLSPDGYIATFEMDPYHQRAAGVYDIAIVPDPAVTPLTSVETPDPTGSSPSITAPNDTAFQIAFEEPLAEALQLEDLPEDEPPAIDNPEPPPPDTPVLPSAVPVDNGTFPAVNVPTTLPVPTPARPRVGLTPHNAVPASVAGVPNDRLHRLMAMGLLAALAAAMWWVGGLDARAPKPVGAGAGAGAGAAGAGAVAGDDESADGENRMGGIGRFAKLRSGRPRKLL